MARDYPVAYRRGSARHDGVRLSNTSGGSALEQAIRETNRNNRAETQLREALRETQRRKDHPGQTRIPKSEGTVLKRASGLALKRFPIATALKAASAMLEEANRDAATSMHVRPGLTGVASGTCPIVDPLDYSIQHNGLPSPTCNTGQGAGPGYFHDCALGLGIWIKRLVSPHFNTVRWWAAPASQAACLAIKRRAGFGDFPIPYPNMGISGWKKDVSLGAVVKSAVGHKPAPEVPPSIDPGAAHVWGNAVTVSLPTVLVTNRTGEGPGVANERSSWQFGTGTETKPKTETLEVAPDKPAQKGEKERKAVVGRSLLRLLSVVTEEMDAVVAVYDCVPKKYRPKGKVSFKEKAQTVYDHWDKIDLRCAAFNLLWERAEDWLYAMQSKATKNPFSQGRRQVSGGRSLQVSQQGDADLPHGQLPLSDLKKWLEEQTGWRPQNGPS